MSLLYIVVHVRCRRQESSRSLSHLLMSFLLPILSNGCVFTFRCIITGIVCSLIVVVSAGESVMQKCNIAVSYSVVFTALHACDENSVCPSTHLSVRLSNT